MVTPATCRVNQAPTKPLLLRADARRVSSRRGSPVETRHRSFTPFYRPPAFLLLHVLLMKLTLKHQLRPRPFTSMLGFLDLKTGVILVVLFAVRTHNPRSYPALLTSFPRCSTRSLVFTASLLFSRVQVETLLNLPSTYTPPSPLSVSHGVFAQSIKFAILSDPLSYPTHISLRRRTPSICFILLIYSSPIISLIPSGPFISSFSGGYIPPMTADATQTLQRSRRLSMDTLASTRP